MPTDIGTTLHFTLWCFIGPFILLIMGFVVWWLFFSDHGDQETQRIDEIWKYYDEWGEEVCRLLINGQIKPDMIERMVLVAWGEPTTKQAESDQKEKWHYTSHSYVVFEQGKVVEVVGKGPLAPDKSTNYRPVLGGMGVLVVMISIIIFVLIVGRSLEFY